MTKYISGRQKNLKVGISSYSENRTSVQVIGNVGIGTTIAGSKLYVVGDGYYTGIITAKDLSISSSVNFGSLNVSGISTLASNGGITTTGGDLYVGNNLYVYNDLVFDDLTANDASFSGNLNVSGIVTASSFVPSSGYIKAPDGTNALYIYNSSGNVAFQGTIGASQINNASGYKVVGFSGTSITFENNAYISGITTSVGGFVGDLTGTATTAINLSDAANITTGIINSSRLSGSYGIDITGTATTATKLQTSRTFEITGDIVASPISFDGTGNVSLAATIQPNSVGLGTDTTGDYVQEISGTSQQIVVTNGSGEGSSPVISLPSNLFTPQDLTVTRDLQVNRNLNVTGNITIGGTSAVIFANELKVYDPDLVLGIRTDGSGNDISTDNTANHGGISIASTEGSPLVSLYNLGIGESTPSTYKKIMWFKEGSFAGLGTDAWLINYAVGIGSTQFPTGTRLAVSGVQFTERDLSVVRNVNASGIITGTLANTLTLNTSGIGITGLETYNNSGVKTFTVTSNATNSNTPNTLVSRDSSGDFSAGTITASLSGTATTATNLSDAGNITTGTINSARLTGTYNIDISGSAGYATTAGIATNLKGGSIGNVPYQSASDTTAFVTNGGVGQVLISNGNAAPYWGNVSAASGSFGGITIRDEGNLVGTANSIVTLNFVGSNIFATATSGANGIATITVSDNLVGTALSINGISTIGNLTITPVGTGATVGGIGVTYYGDGTNLTGISAGLAISDDTVTDATRYISFVSSTTGTIASANVSSTRLTFNPSTGNLVAGGTVTANSDERLKINIKTIENALDKVLSLRGVEFDRTDTNDHQIGVIAQEVEQIVPEVVYPKFAQDGETKSVAYSNMIGLLIEAIKEQNKKIIDLERRLEEK